MVTIDAILEKATQIGASDVILTHRMPPLFMVQGQIRHADDPPLEAQEIRTLVYSMLENLQIAKFEQERELDFGISYAGFRFRCNAFWQRGTVGAALRLVPTIIPAMETLGLPPVIKEFTEAHQGLVLITGPTGHGKSTTQAAMIDYINRTRACHIITIEDPIEFLHSNNRSVVEHREVGSDTRSFSDALRHVLRQAPHVILVGEMRDLETIGTALTAAETGHLVISTLHTNNAAQSVDRVIDVFPPYQQNQIRAQFAASLLGIVAQRLLPTVDGMARVLACEVLRNTPAVANLIRESKNVMIQNVMETTAKIGMISMDTAIKNLYLAGKITEEVARRAMKYPQTLFS